MLKSIKHHNIKNTHEKVEHVLKTIASKTNIGIIIDSDALGVDIS